jgi:3D-(3,5/4)-trihydroxycyclohexane-1,2-dione acylhydrolase (decyclizing)
MLVPEIGRKEGTMAVGRQNQRLTMSQALVKYLQSQYSERDGENRRLIPGMFGIFGHGNVAGLGQALEEYGADLPYYRSFNEQSMVHTAAGFAKATLRQSTLACTASIGPGSTNMVTGAALATINRLPVLLLPADYYVTRFQGNVLQQLEHPVSADVSVNDCFRPVSRFFDRISRPEQLLTALPEAMRVLIDPAETGAVTLALPQDIQAQAYDYPASFFEKRVWRIERRLPDPQRVKEVVAILRSAERPMIIAGGGVHYAKASEELCAFAEEFGLPVSETCGGKGSLLRDSGLYLGGQGVDGGTAATEISAKADLVICIGTRLTDFTTGSRSCFQHPDVRFVGINVCGHDAYKLGGLPLVADARETLRAISRMARDAGCRPRPEYIDEIAQARERWQTMVNQVYQEVDGEAMTQSHLIGILNSESRPGDTVISAAGSLPGDLLKLWSASNGRRCHLEFGYSCMGYEVPAGLGVRMSQPEGEVYVFIGDGTYLMNPSELVTAAQEGLKVTVIVSENHGYQVIRRLQMLRSGTSFGNEFRRREDGTKRLTGDFLKIDFAAHARSMGARAWNAATSDAFRKALHEAREEKRSCVIVAEVDPYRFAPASDVWWDVAAAEVSGASVTRQLRKAYETDRVEKQRFFY